MVSKVSILIPAYNVEKYIARCLDSVVGQTFKDIEIIIVNDGSTDGTASIIDEYASRDSRIRVVNHPENCGLMWARKTCIEAATGDYLMFVDSDDYLDSMICETLLAKAEEEGADLVVCGVNEVLADGKLKPYYNKLSYGGSSGSFMRSMLLGELWHSLWAKLFERRIFVDSVIPFEKKLNKGEDMIIMYAIAGNVRKAVCINDLLYYYCYNEQSLMRDVSDVERINSTVYEWGGKLDKSLGLDPVNRSEVETMTIKIFFNKIKSGDNRATMYELIGKRGLSWLISFRSLVSHLGFRKALTYWMAFRFDFVANALRR